MKTKGSNKSEVKSSGKSYKYLAGQKVFHPFYGVGTVVDRDVSGGSSIISDSLSTIEFGSRNLKIMTRLDKGSMIKKLSSSSEVQDLLKSMQDCEEVNLEDYPTRGSKRYNFALDKMKNGDINKVVEVIRDLSEFNKIKKITTKERELLQSAKDVFCEVLCETEDIDLDEAKEMLNNVL